MRNIWQEKMTKSKVFFKKGLGLGLGHSIAHVAEHDSMVVVNCNRSSKLCLQMWHLYNQPSNYLAVPPPLVSPLNQWYYKEVESLGFEDTIGHLSKVVWVHCWHSSGKFSLVVLELTKFRLKGGVLTAVISKWRKHYHYVGRGVEEKTEQGLTVSCLHLQTDSIHHHKSPAERGTETKPLVMLMCVDDIQQWHEKKEELALPNQDKALWLSSVEAQTSLGQLQKEMGDEWVMHSVHMELSQKGQRLVLPLEKGIKMSLYSLSHIIQVFRNVVIPKLLGKKNVHIENSQIFWWTKKRFLHL